MKKYAQRGFGTLEVITVVVIVGLVGAGGWYVVYHTTHKVQSGNSTSGGTGNNASSGSNGSNNKLATLSGVVTEGPTSPVTQSGGSGYVAVANHVVQVDSDQGTVVATTKTDPQGRYVVHVPPAHYTLVLVPQIGPGTLRDNTVQVALGTNTLNLVADTGIR